MERANARTAVITGASSGIGLVAAKGLAVQGWRIIALGRDPERTAHAQAQIRAAAAPGVVVDMLRADLSLVSSSPGDTRIINVSSSAHERDSGSRAKSS